MSSIPEPAIWSLDTGQQIGCFDSCQSTIHWMPKVKGVAVVNMQFLFFKVRRLRYWHYERIDR